MRARRGLLVGWLAVLAYVALLVAAAATTPTDGRDRTEVLPEVATIDRFVDAWARSRAATFVTTGTFERRSEVTGAVITSQDIVAQRPPRRIHRQLGGVDGRDDDRLLVCPAPPEGEEDQREPCRLGAPGGRTYDESVAREVAGLRSAVSGADPLYRLTEPSPGCFALDLRRPDPRGQFGTEARFCFDPASGAQVERVVRHQGGITDTLRVDDIRLEVTDADLTP